MSIGEQVKERLQKSIDAQTELVSKVNQLDNDRQNLLQEILRLDGEIRVLRELST
jgi:predicted nuclease with TOPRIM domain